MGGATGWIAGAPSDQQHYAGNWGGRGSGCGYRGNHSHIGGGLQKLIDNRRRVVSVVMGVVMGVAIGYKLTAMNLQLKEHRPTKGRTEHVQYNLFAFAELENLLYSSSQVGCPKNVTRTRACVHFWWRL